MTRTLLLILVLSLCLGGCSRVGVLVVDGKPRRTAIPQPRESKFDPAEYAAFEGEGDGVLEGEIVVTGPDGIRWYGAMSEVFLAPVTSYSREWFERSILGDESLETLDARAGTHNRSTVADHAGRFRFERLKPGDYFAYCIVRVYSPVRAGSIGGRVLPPKSSAVKAHARATVVEGSSTMVIVTR